MKILRERDRGCRRGPEAWFNGVVWIDEVVASTAPATFKVNRVSFEPGAKTAWHTHPRGQALHVLSGVCHVQLRGAELQEVTSGGSVWIEPGEIHWHGAADGRTMVHLAIQEADEAGIEVVWLEHVGTTG